MIIRIGAFLLFGSVLLPAYLAADSSLAEIRGTIGGTRIFLDEPFHFTGGGSVRFALTNRIGIEPQLFFSNSSDFREVSFLGNVTFDLVSGDRQIVPYFIAGGGIVNQYDKRINFTSNDPTANGGIGVKAYLGKHLFISPEARLGAHAFPQLTVSLGYLFSGIR